MAGTYLICGKKLSDNWLLGQKKLSKNGRLDTVAAVEHYA